ncbi:MAG: peptidase, partial [Angustibacter sp.]
MTRFTRSGARALILALTLCWALAPTGASAAPSSATRADWASSWLAAQLVTGSHFESTFGTDTYPDQGLTIDAILAFAAAKVAEPQAAAATAWLSQPGILGGYVGNGSTESYSGAHAKAALALQVRGLNPRSVAGRDLIAELQDLQASTGRFQDRSAFGDFSNAFGQSLAVIALRRAEQNTGKASAYLVGQACPDGGIPVQFDQATCVSNADATAIGIQALRASGRAAAATAASSWLVSQQASTGGFGAATNANSTGLAAAALHVSGQFGPAAQARGALAALQQGCAAPAAQRGAIALDGNGFVLGSAVRATPQAILGLA